VFYPCFLNVPCNAQLCKTAFLIQIHHLLNIKQKTCCAATLFQLKSLHRRYKLHIPRPAADGRPRSLRCTSSPHKAHPTLWGPLVSAVLLNPLRSLMFLGFIPAAIGAVHGASFGRKWLSTVLAPLGGSALQSGIQFRIVGQHTLPEIPAHGISAVHLLQHHTATIQWQTAIILMVVGTVVYHQFPNSSSFFFGQFPNVFCHGQMVPFCFIVVSNPSCPLGLLPH